MLSKAIPGYEGLYEVDDQGLVYSLNFRGKKGNRQPIKAGYNHKGYLQVSLYKDGVETMARVHRLVLLTFVGDPGEGIQGCHLNGKRDDNRLCNLRWDNQSGNQLDRRLHGTDPRGVRQHKAKLTDDDVRDIRHWSNTTKLKQKEIGFIYGVAENTISRILSGKIWTHVV